MPSKGEEKIAKFLTAAHINFKREVSLPDLKSLKGKPLRFDFAIYNGNKIAFFIEYDG